MSDIRTHHGISARQTPPIVKESSRMLEIQPAIALQ